MIIMQPPSGALPTATKHATEPTVPFDTLNDELKNAVCGVLFVADFSIPIPICGHIYAVNKKSTESNLLFIILVK